MNSNIRNNGSLASFKHNVFKSLLAELKAAMLLRDWSKSTGEGVGRSREGVGHEVLSLVQGVGRAICSYP